MVYILLLLSSEKEMEAKNKKTFTFSLSANVAERVCVRATNGFFPPLSLKEGWGGRERGGEASGFFSST